MKTLSFLLITMLSCVSSYASEITKDLKHFTRIVASPRINVILEKGDSETIRVQYNDVSQSRINILVRGKTLHIFLDQARKVEKTIRDDHGSRHGIYEGATITAYITYKELDMLEIRGNQELTCHGDIVSPEFTLRAYGENDITLASLETEYFRAALYGENKLKVNDGKVLEQRYRLFGKNKIDTRDMKSEYTSTSIFGVGKLKINSSEEVRVNAFGEPKIYVDGDGYVQRRLIFGRVQINRQ
jgi:hypothetical protein